jgi:hypothetical protein
MAAGTQAQALAQPLRQMAQQFARQVRPYRLGSGTAAATALIQMRMMPQPLVRPRPSLPCVWNR